MQASRHPFGLAPAALILIAALLPPAGCREETQQHARATPAPTRPEPAPPEPVLEKPPAEEQPAEEPPAAPPPSTPAAEAPAEQVVADAPVDEVKPWIEYWEGTKVVKYRYEMRKGANGRWARNGRAQAYYIDGTLEREGDYKDDKRVGKWTYYKPDGSFLRTEDRGAGG